MDKMKEKNILVLEDNPDVLEGIMNILEFIGYRSEGVAKFDNGLMEKVKQDNFGLLIVDVMLSGSDGRDFTKAVKGDKETANLPVLMISAYPEVERSTIEAGADDFLKKPFDIDQLIEKVKKFM